MKKTISKQQHNDNKLWTCLEDINNQSKHLNNLISCFLKYYFSSQIQLKCFTLNIFIYLKAPLNSDDNLCVYFIKGGKNGYHSSKYAWVIIKWLHPVLRQHSLRAAKHPWRQCYAISFCLHCGMNSTRKTINLHISWFSIKVM